MRQTETAVQPLQVATGAGKAAGGDAVSAASAAAAASAGSAHGAGTAANVERDAGRRIAGLEAQVAALQAALIKRSDEMRVLQRLLCARDLERWNRLAAGRAIEPRLPVEPDMWLESHDLTQAEVPETLEALWESIYPPRP